MFLNGASYEEDVQTTFSYGFWRFTYYSYNVRSTSTKCGQATASVAELTAVPPQLFHQPKQGHSKASPSGIKIKQH